MGVEELAQCCQERQNQCDDSMMNSELFKHQRRRSRKQKLIKSPFWAKNEVFAVSDLCAEEFHSACPKASTLTLLGVTFVCTCWCHGKKTRKKKGKGGTAALEFGCESPTSRRCEPSRVLTPARTTKERTYNG